MENEELNQVENEEGLPPAEIDNFDELWEEGDEMYAFKDSEPEEETEAPEAEAAGEPDNGEETKPEEPKQETENQRFKLKYNGEESEVDLEKVIELAQKGMDYDRIKQQRDELKADSATMKRYKDQDSFLKELAESSEITVEDLIEQTKARMLMSKDESLTEDEALKQVRGAKQAAEKKETTKAEPTPEERRQAMFANFMSAYPNVKADDIPKEVWEDAGRTFDLTGAYQRWENRELRKEIELLRQNNKNKERSTGSVKSVGSRTKDQAFDALWYDDDD